MNPLAEDTGKVVVLVFLRRDCPVSSRYAPTIRQISKEYADCADFGWWIPTTTILRRKFVNICPTMDINCPHCEIPLSWSNWAECRSLRKSRYSTASSTGVRGPDRQLVCRYLPRPFRADHARTGRRDSRGLHRQGRGAQRSQRSGMLHLRSRMSSLASWRGLDADHLDGVVAPLACVRVQASSERVLARTSPSIVISLRSCFILARNVIGQEKRRRFLC